ncbi:MAG: 4Fe-4S binding protein, partial [Kiloniellales bacterium]|nr:4Fe-4S binding protein [Kiloniellales bacterium]
MNACTRCEACVSACPESVIGQDSQGFPRLDFSSGECTFCGECVSACEPEALSLNRARPWCAHAEIQTSCLALEG